MIPYQDRVAIRPARQARIALWTAAVARSDGCVYPSDWIVVFCFSRQEAQAFHIESQEHEVFGLGCFLH
jgi:hypothetical protein